MNKAKDLNDMIEKEREYNRLQNEQAVTEAAFEQNRVERLRYEDALRARGIKTESSKINFHTAVTKYVTEEVLSAIFDKCFKNADEEECGFNKSLVQDFVDQEGAGSLLNNIESKSVFLSELALNIRQTVKTILEGVDPENPSTEMVDPAEIEDVITTINGSEEVEDIADEIRMKVSRATEEFVEKNMMDKINIKDIMLTADEKLKAVKSGDDTTDAQIKTEQVNAVKRSISSIHRRPHSVYEKLILNLAEACVSNEELKAQYVSESGKINMDAVSTKAVSIYTFLEFVNSLKLKELTEEYILDTITIK